jgi:hypothetical protein
MDLFLVLFEQTPFKTTGRDERSALVAIPSLDMTKMPLLATARCV